MKTFNSRLFLFIPILLIACNQSDVQEVKSSDNSINYGNIPPNIEKISSLSISGRNTVTIDGVKVDVPIITDTEIKKLNLNAKNLVNSSKNKIYGLDNPEKTVNLPKYGRKTDNSVLKGLSGPQVGHGYMGYNYYSSPSAKITGVYAIQSVSRTQDIPANPPFNYTTDLYLYAPTLYPPNGCIESVTWYQKSISNGSMIRRWGAWDWCRSNPGFAIYKDMDDTFWSKYVYANSSNYSYRYSYAVKIVNTSENIWHVYLYNFTNGGWEDIYVSSGISQTGTENAGWSMFEGYLQDNKCPFDLIDYQSANNQYQINSGAWNQLTQSASGNGSDLIYQTDCMDSGFYIRRHTPDWQVSLLNKFPEPGKLTIWSNAGGLVSIDGDPKGRAQITIPVSTGNHVLKIQTNNFPDYISNITVPSNGLVLDVIR